jgi:hypothetical protein
MPSNGKWFNDFFSYYDIVQITGTSTQLAPDAGGWDIPRDQWLPGRVILVTASSAKSLRKLLRWYRCQVSAARPGRLGGLIDGG